MSTIKSPEKFEIFSKLTIKTAEQRQGSFSAAGFLSLKIHLGKQKILIIEVCKPPSNNHETFMKEKHNNLGKSVNIASPYGNISFMKCHFGQKVEKFLNMNGQDHHDERSRF